ncbi:MAG: DUF547 domain-containing protein [Cyclobacteriaceae bacterium]
MKNLLTVFLFLSVFGVSAQDIFDRQDAFLKKYSLGGKVDYAPLKSDPKQLNALVQEIADFDLSNKRVTGDFIKAFYINAYNILVIKQVVDLYPIDGPLAVSGFFDKIQNTVMGEKMTLNELEKERLYPQFPDPRLHFVLVCAADGCPPLANYAFRPQNLDDQLTERTTFVLDLGGLIRLKNNKVELSQIFEWYKSDFTKHGSLLDFINKYRTEKINTKITTTFYPYMWSLNNID